MIPTDLLQQIEKEIGEQIDSVKPVSGGDINLSYRLKTNSSSFFVKINNPNSYPGMFEAESNGLELLHSKSQFNIPKPIKTGVTSTHSYLLMEYLKSGTKRDDFWVEFGKRLAMLHLQTAEKFGLDHNNYIGSLSQSNRMFNSWSEFFVSERLEPMIRMAREKGTMDRGVSQQFDRLFSKVELIFPIEPPSLIHGDLWSGNFGIDAQGNATIFDPAIYFGHREMDLGMSQLFGGFHSDFYEAYHQQYPLEKQWEKRLEVANLYPLLVHLNLFGTSYLGQIKNILNYYS